MAGLNCDVCGGKVVASKREEWFQCENCGTEYPLEWMKVKFQKTQTVTMEGSVKVEGVADAASLLRRAFLLLEDGEFIRADGLLDQVLNIEPENAQAYVGKLMSEMKIQDERALAKTFSRAKGDILSRIGDGTLPEVEKLVNENEKLKAIKMLRELSGLDLEEAKNYVDGTASYKIKSALNPAYNANFKNALRFADGDMKSTLEGYNNLLIARIDADECDAKQNNILEMSIEELDLSVGTYNRLKRGGISAIADIVCKTEDDMLKISNLRKEHLYEVLNKLGTLNLTLKGRL